MPSGHVDRSKPLRPLSEKAWAALRLIGARKVLAFEINPGIRGRLYREDLIVDTGHAYVVLTPAGHRKLETVHIDGRVYRRFISYPEQVTDGTVRCFICGQIDDPPWHLPAACRRP